MRVSFVVSSVSQLLFLDQTQAVISVFAARFGAMHAGTVIAALEIFGRAKDGNAEPAANANARTCVTSHVWLRVES